MTKDDFKQTLIKQYTEVIEEIIIECKSICHPQIDYNVFDSKVKSIIMAARIDGLEEGVIWGILEHRIPDYIDYITGEKLAA